LAKPVKRLLNQLRERQIFPVVIAYLAFSWLIIQAVAIIFPALMFPDWSVRAVIIATIAGFPLIVVLAWFFNVTSHGIARVNKLSSVLAGSMGMDASPRFPAVEGAVASVSVLPFESLGDDPENQALADGLATEIHATLGQMHQVQVASRRSSFRFRDSAQSVEEIARDLGVRYVLSGSLMRAGEQIRVIAELDDGADGHQLWTQKYEVGLDDVFAVQTEIAAAIVGAFGMQREKAEIARAKQRPTRSLDAWSLVQKARNYINDYSEATLTEAEALLTRAIKLDNEYAIAHATLGSVLIEQVINGYSDSAEADREKALTAVEKALSLDANDTYVLKMAGMVLAHCGRLDESLMVLRNCVELAPFDFGAWGYMGWPLNARATDEDLLEVHSIMDRLLSSAAEHPGAAYWLYHKSVASCLQGHPEQSEQLMLEAAAKQKPVPWALMHFANVCGLLNRHDAAQEAVAQAAALNPKMTPALFADSIREMTHASKSGAVRLEGLVMAGVLQGGGNK